MNFKYSLKTIIVCIIIFCVISSCKALLGGGNKKPPKTRFSVSSKNIESGDSTKLYWEIEEADSIILEGYPGYLPPSGNLPIKLDTTTSFLVRVYRDGEIKKRKQTIETFLPEVSYLEAPDSVSDEDEFEVKWRVRNARYASIEGISDSLPTYGDMIISRDTTTTFILKAIGKYHSDTMSHTTKVHLIENIEAPQKIFRGQPAFITWSLKRTDSVSIDGFDEHFNASDTLVFKPSQTMSLTLKAHKVYGGIVHHDRIIVVLPPRIQFTGSTTIIEGEPAYVAWSVYGGDSVKINPGNKRVLMKGKQVFYPKRDTSISLMVYEGDKVLDRNLTVHVLYGRKKVHSYKPVFELKDDERIDMDIIAWNKQPDSAKISLYAIVTDTSGNMITGLGPPNITLNKAKDIFKSVEIAEPERKKIPDFQILSNWNKDGLMNARFKILIADAQALQNKIIHSSDFWNKIGGFIQENDSIEVFLPVNQKLSSFWLKKGGGVDFSIPQQEGFPFRSPHKYISEIISTINQDQKQKYLLVYSGGNDNASYLDCAHSENIHLPGALKNKNIKLFYITNNRNLEWEMVKDWCDFTGGKLYAISNQNEIVNIFTEIAILFNNGYEISFAEELLQSNTEVLLTYDNRNSGDYSVKRRLCLLNNLGQESINDSSQYWLCEPEGQPLMPPQHLVYFNTNDAKVDPEFSQRLDGIVKCLHEDPSRSILLLGHSDLLGSEEACDSISRERAEEVAEYLSREGVDKKRIQVSYYGKSYPVWYPEQNAFEAYENRRVEIVYFRMY